MSEKRIYATVRLMDVPYSLDMAYSYYIPPSMEKAVLPGTFVSVPFGGGNRLKSAVVTDVSENCGVDASLVKPVFQVSAGGVLLDEEARDICSFLCGYTLCTYSDAVRCTVPSTAFFKFDEYYYADEDISRAALKKLRQRELFAYTYISEKGKVGYAAFSNFFGDDAGEVLAKLCKQGIIKKETRIKENSNIKYTTYITKTGKSEPLRSPIQSEITELLEKVGRISADELYIRMGKNVSVQLKSLEKKGLIISEKIKEYRSPYLKEHFEAPDESVLSEHQTEALNKIDSLRRDNKASACLLHGITGSGKTRVIKAMIDRVISDGKSVIMLVPEISLTPQTVSFFCGYYGERVAVIHSNLSRGERFDEWMRIKEGKADIVIGTRSAVFAPIKNLGMIVIDEEQEHTYKSDMNPKYSAVDVARFRCGKNSALMLLSSATPSLNSYYKATTGAYTLVELSERYGGATLPKVLISDMREESEGGNTSPVGSVLYESIKKNFREKKQSIVFLNRRGYNTAVCCRVCGEAIKCPECSVSLTYHINAPLGETDTTEEYIKIRRQRGVLSCHYCGYKTNVPKLCPSCNAEHFRYAGCGTEQAEEEIAKIVPEAKILRMDTDTTGKKEAFQKILGQFRRKEADILIGTQMVTKGHDFPAVTLVGVMNADSSLYLDDYRASEKTFSTITQVVGRAGRAKDEGTAVIQTVNPDSEVIRLAAIQDYKTFFEKEIRLRKALTFPPFCDIAVLTVSSKDESLLSTVSVKLSERIKELLTTDYSDVPLIMFGPFEAPIYKIQNLCRMRIVTKCKLNRKTRALFRQILLDFGKVTVKNITLSLDFNPSDL